MKIAIAGLANSHPFTDARHLRELREDAGFIVADPDPERVERFLEEQPGSVAVATVEEMLEHSPSAAIVTVPPTAVGDIVEAFLAAGVPTYVCKPAAVTSEQFRRLEALVQGREQLFFTTSVLRYASAAAELPGEVGFAHVVAEHHIDYWREPGSRWQDDPEVGGGLVPMMGVHAFELLEHLLGPTMRVTSCTTIRIRDDGALASPDLATGTAANDYGLLASFEVDGLAEGQRYAMELSTDESTHRIQLGEGADPFGSLTVARIVAAMAEGAPSPLPWERTRAVLRAVVDARAFAEA